LAIDAELRAARTTVHNHFKIELAQACGDQRARRDDRTAGRANERDAEGVGHGARAIFPTRLPIR
jgi:hypothetical protein